MNTTDLIENALYWLRRAPKNEETDKAIHFLEMIDKEELLNNEPYTV
jgi:hypothetical protein